MSYFLTNKSYVVLCQKTEYGISSSILSLYYLSSYFIVVAVFVKCLSFYYEILGSTFKVYQRRGNMVSSYLSLLFMLYKALYPFFTSFLSEGNECKVVCNVKQVSSSKFLFKLTQLYKCENQFPAPGYYYSEKYPSTTDECLLFTYCSDIYSHGCK